MGRNKTVVCGKCYRVMRMDNMTRHIKMHEKHREKQEEFTPSIRSWTTSKNNVKWPILMSQPWTKESTLDISQ